MSEEKKRINYIPNTASDPRCLNCRAQHCFQCEHRSEYNRLKESPRKQPQREEYRKKEVVVDHTANTPRQKTPPPPKKKSCCC